MVEKEVFSMPEEDKAEIVEKREEIRETAQGTVRVIITKDSAGGAGGSVPDGSFHVNHGKD